MLKCSSAQDQNLVQILYDFVRQPQKKSSIPLNNPRSTEKIMQNQNDPMPARPRICLLINVPNNRLQKPGFGAGVGLSWPIDLLCLRAGLPKAFGFQMFGALNDKGARFSEHVLT